MTQQTQGGQDVRAVAPQCMGGMDICRERWCHTAVAEQGGRWFITMGHPGYNTLTNNAQGYASAAAAKATITRCSRPQQALPTCGCKDAACRSRVHAGGRCAVTVRSQNDRLCPWCQQVQVTITR